MNTAEDTEQWTMVIKPKTGWFDLDLKGIWQYRDLIMLFVRRDFVSLYKQTILGPLWFIIQPLLMTITFTVVFGKIAGISTDGLPQPVFYMAGIVPWAYFAACLNKTSNTFMGNSNIFGKVYFPRLVMPISVVITSLISFAIQFLFFLLFWGYYYWQGAVGIPQKELILLPLLIVVMAALGLGFGIIITSMTTKYRDLKFLIGFSVQLLMYASPVIYPLSTVEGKLKTILLLNPMTPIIEAFRFIFLGKGLFDWTYLSYSCAFAAFVLIVGIIIFSRIEKTFMDTV